MQFWDCRVLFWGLGRNATVTATTSIQRHARGEEFKSTIFARTIRPRRNIYRDFCHILLVESGTGTITTDDESIELTGRSVFFMSQGLDCDFSLSAGAEGYLLGFSPNLLADAIGNKAESVLLRRFTERPAILADIEFSVGEDILWQCRGIIKELRRENRGSWMALSAFARLILYELWRSSDVELDQVKCQGEAISILKSFRQIIEVRFRAHVSIGDLARELGVSHDRLHAICRRTLGRTPLQLLHERIIHEAKLRLERSADTIQEIGHQLGYSDATNFSHFFKKQTGLAPGQYRRIAKNRDATTLEAFTQTFADWP